MQPPLPSGIHFGCISALGCKHGNLGREFTFRRPAAQLLDAIPWFHTWHPWLLPASRGCTFILHDAYACNLPVSSGLHFGCTCTLARKLAASRLQPPLSNEIHVGCTCTWLHFDGGGEVPEVPVLRPEVLVHRPEVLVHRPELLVDFYQKSPELLLFSLISHCSIDQDFWSLLPEVLLFSLTENSRSSGFLSERRFPSTRTSAFTDQDFCFDRPGLLVEGTRTSGRPTRSRQNFWSAELLVEEQDFW